MNGLKCFAWVVFPMATLLQSATGFAQSTPAQPAVAPAAGPAGPSPAMQSAPAPAPAPMTGGAAPAPPAYAAPAHPYPPPAVVQPAQPYAVMDPSSGQIMLVPPYGSAQRTAPGELPYVEGAPVPRGYAVDEYHPRGLIIGGAVTLGTLYAISLSVAAGGDFDSSNGWLAAPIIGPFGWLAARKAPTCTSNTYYYDSSCESDESSKRTMVVLDGLGQVAGAAMLIAGMAITRKHLVLVNPQEAIAVAPYASSTGSGLRLVGRF